MSKDRSRDERMGCGCLLSASGLSMGLATACYFDIRIFFGVLSVLLFLAGIDILKGELR